MKKIISVKPVTVSNGHAAAPNGPADDEGGGVTPRVSYAAAAKKPPSPYINNTPASFSLPTGNWTIYND